MFAPTPAEAKTAKKFKKKLDLHLPENDGVPRLLRIRGKCPDTQKTLGEAVFIPERDIIHVFDHDTLLAVSHAIEDLASEVREGELIATFQTFDNFLPHKKRYQSLARDLDAVRVWGSGTAPKGCPGIDFIRSDNEKMMRYWLVLFESQNDHAVLVCKQVGAGSSAASPEGKKFVGFYSFCPYLVQSIRWRFNLVSSGLKTVIQHWENTFSLPDLKMRDLDLGAYLRPQPAPKAPAKAKPKAKAAPAAKTASRSRK